MTLARPSKQALKSFHNQVFHTESLQRPLSLVRLVERQRHLATQSRNSETYWMLKQDFQKLQQEARRELGKQGIANPALTGLYMRFEARDDLAVCRDWSHLDSYLIWDIPPQSGVLAYIGQAARQPYYSKKAKTHQRAEAAGVSLPGLGTQLVIDFNLKENFSHKSLIRGPFLF